MLKKFLSTLNIPTSKAQYIISKVEIAHMIQGRIRLIYKDIKNYESLCDEIKATLDKEVAVINYKLNTITGSITIEYDEKKVASDPFLQELLTLALQKYTG